MSERCNYTRHENTTQFRQWTLPLDDTWKTNITHPSVQKMQNESNSKSQKHMLMTLRSVDSTCWTKRCDAILFSIVGDETQASLALLLWELQLPTRILLWVCWIYDGHDLTSAIVCQPPLFSFSILMNADSSNMCSKLPMGPRRIALDGRKLHWPTVFCMDRSPDRQSKALNPNSDNEHYRSQIYAML